MKNLPYYPIIFITGFCSLVYQVVWQRYLTIILGSEARSTTIIVAIFLLGLALGYYLFGKISTLFCSRRKLLKLYGWLELTTGAYAIMFPYLFWYLAESSLGQSTFYPAEISLGLILLILPTVLMGATVPVMTSVLPQDNLQINTTHARIYGLNTIGGFCGVMLGSFILIPAFGLSETLSVVGGLNALAALVYIGNRLEAEIAGQSEQTYIRSDIPRPVLYLWAFISGAVVIALEVAWFRVLGLAIGSSHLVFPFILSLFVLGLGYGSLSSKVKDIEGLKRQLQFSLGFLLLSFLVAPWLPWLISNIRVSMTSIAPNYYLFYCAVYLLLALVLLPAVIPMGRVLPAVFAVMPRKDSDFGRQCGLVYFVNTIGTFAGGTVGGYLLFYLLDLGAVIKLQIFLYALILVSLFYYTAKRKQAMALFVVGVVLFASLPFYRGYHSISLFRESRYNPQVHYTNIFSRLPDKQGLLFMEDGPDSTAAVIEYGSGENHSKSIFVNGKSDSNTLLDYGTLTLLALIPYFYSPINHNIRASVIGAGTGVTAAVLNELPAVSELHLIEISSSVINALPYFDDINNGLTQSPKLQMHHTDAFRYYRGMKGQDDIIISEPTNPWTVGVENLYTKYFYRMVSQRLSDGGIFCQWFHTYSTNNKLVATVLQNISRYFDYIHIYRTEASDIGLIASNHPLIMNIEEYRLNKKTSEVFNRLKFPPTMLPLLREYGNRELVLVLDNKPYYQHDVDFPQINFRSLRPFFLEHNADLRELVPPFQVRLGEPDRVENIKRALLMALYEEKEQFVENCTTGLPSIYCDYLRGLVALLEQYLTDEQQDTRLTAYSSLRHQGLIDSNMEFLHDQFTQTSDTNLRMMAFIFDEFAKEGDYKTATAILEQMEEIGSNEGNELAKKMLSLLEQLKGKNRY